MYERKSLYTLSEKVWFLENLGCAVQLQEIWDSAYAVLYQMVMPIITILQFNENICRVYTLERNTQKILCIVLLSKYLSLAFINFFIQLNKVSKQVCYFLKNTNYFLWAAKLNYTFLMNETRKRLDAKASE